MSDHRNSRKRLPKQPTTHNSDGILGATHRPDRIPGMYAEFEGPP